MRSNSRTNIICIASLLAGLAASGCLNYKDKWTGGLAMDLVKEDTLTVVSAVLAGTRSARAGIMPGDVLVAVDGEPMTGAPVEMAYESLNGPVGSPVTLTIRRQTALFNVTVERMMLKRLKPGIPVQRTDEPMPPGAVPVEEPAPVTEQDSTTDSTSPTVDDVDPPLDTWRPATPDTDEADTDEADTDEPDTDEPAAEQDNKDAADSEKPTESAPEDTVPEKTPSKKPGGIAPSPYEETSADDGKTS